MSANFLSERGEFRGQPAWHRAGNVFDLMAKVLLIDAATKHWSDIKIKKQPLFTAGIPIANGTGGFDIPPFQIPGRFAVVRLPIPEDPKLMYLGDVGKGWETKDPIYYAKQLNDLSKKFPLETLGTLGLGERCFFSLRDEPVTVAASNGFKDELWSHYVFELSLEPGRSHRCFSTHTRVVCENTLMAGWANAQYKMKIPHSMDAEEGYEWMITTAEHAKTASEEDRKVYEKFMSVPFRVDSPDFDLYLSDVYPLPAVPARVTRHNNMNPDQRANLSDTQNEAIEKDERRFVTGSERAKKLRENVRELAHGFNDDYGAVANTVWMAYNATTELATHRKKQGREDVAESVLTGARSEEIRNSYDLLVERCEMSLN